MSIKTQILDAIVAKLTELKTSGDISTVNWEVIKMNQDDFDGWELPAVQVIAQEEIVEHEQGRARKEFSVVVEVFLKSTTEGIINQRDLYDLQNIVELKLFEKPQLGIPRVIGMVYNGSITDLHLLEPMYYVRLDLTVKYYDPLTGTC